MKKGLTLEVCDLDHDAAVDPPELAAEATGGREGGREGKAPENSLLLSVCGQAVVEDGDEEEVVGGVEVVVVVLRFCIPSSTSPTLFLFLTVFFFFLFGFRLKNLSCCLQFFLEKLPQKEEKESFRRCFR